MESHFIEELRMEAENILKYFKENLVLGEECVGPSSYWTPEMSMLVQEQGLPLDMRVYHGYKTYTERTFGKWHFFAPWHVFRLPHDDEYIIAQSGRTKWLTFNHRKNLYKIKILGEEYATENTFRQIMDKL